MSASTKAKPQQRQALTTDGPNADKAPAPTRRGPRHKTSSTQRDNVQGFGRCDMTADDHVNKERQGKTQGCVGATKRRGTAPRSSAGRSAAKSVAAVGDGSNCTPPPVTPYLISPRPPLVHVGHHRGRVTERGLVFPWACRTARPPRPHAQRPTPHVTPPNTGRPGGPPPPARRPRGVAAGGRGGAGGGVCRPGPATDLRHRRRPEGNLPCTVDSAMAAAQGRHRGRPAGGGRPPTRGRPLAAGAAARLHPCRAGSLFDERGPTTTPATTTTTITATTTTIDARLRGHSPRCDRGS